MGLGDFEKEFENGVWRFRGQDRGSGRGFVCRRSKKLTKFWEICKKLRVMPKFLWDLVVRNSLSNVFAV